MAEVLVEFTDPVTASTGDEYIARIAPPLFDQPAPSFAPAAPMNEGVLNPFSVYRKGEALLRSQLGALSPWHLVNIVRAYDLSELDQKVLNQTPASVLIELIVTAVRSQIESGALR